MSSNGGGFNNILYLDFGATHHVTPNARNLVDVVSFSRTNQVHVGNGQGLLITSIGSMNFTSPFHPQTTLKLKNLLFVPSIIKNLVSVSQFAKDNNVYFEFPFNECFVKCKNSSKVLMRGSLGSDGLYQFHHHSAPQSSAPSSHILTVSIAYSKNKMFPSIRNLSSLQFDTFQCNNHDGSQHVSTNSAGSF